MPDRIILARNASIGIDKALASKPKVYKQAEFFDVDDQSSSYNM
jgi:hypothetical protein